MVAPEKLIEIRKKAQDAVADMREGELKLKAFEIILGHLLDAESLAKTIESSPIHEPNSKKSKSAPIPGSTKSRVLLLKDEGFFALPRSLSEIKEELHAHGWILPMTALSGPVQGLVQERKLRRIKEQGNKQKVWKYVNP